jgi:hypothetical protein
MEQLWDALWKLTEDYKILQRPSATRELQQSKIAHKSSGEELKQIKTILEKLTSTSDHVKLREAFQGTSPRFKKAAKPIGASAKSWVDKQESQALKGSSLRSNHTAMHVDVWGLQSSALDRVQSAIWKHNARQKRDEASGKKFTSPPRRQIYVGNRAFNAETQDVGETIDEITDCVTKVTVTMPNTADPSRNHSVRPESEKVAQKASDSHFFKL